MKLGAIAIDDALGAVLARAVRIEDERFGVGHRLSADDVEVLRAGGVGSVVAGRLDVGDVGREEAARRIAEAVAGEGVRVEPGEGRYDLFAEARGVWVAPASGVDAINCMDEALAFATLPSYQLVEDGERVASVSLATLAIPGDPLSAAISEAMAHRVSVATLVERRAGLVLTGSAGEDLDATAATESARLSALGSSVAQTIRCDHEMGPVAEAIRALVDAGLHPILIASSMPIVDRDDVVPSALEDAGGLVEHFGVPADPGTALMLGRHGKAAVLGVPYPATVDGAYQDVLQRIVAGLPVTSEIVMRLGCGGLSNHDEP